ncbi:Uncharacterised protein [uncultured archaeon]|nr:Uncharacterised protein [uncultured archaeon]
MAGDITRITLNVHNFYNSETIEAFSNEELGQYVRLMCKAILIGKEASLPDDRKLLAKYAGATERKLSDAVLSQYPVVLTEYGPRRRNSVLYEEWCKVCEKTEKARESGEAGNKKKSELKRLQSTNELRERDADASQTALERDADVTLTEHNKTKQNITKQHDQGGSPSVGDVLDETAAGMADGKPAGPMRKPTELGFFKRGQYPGTDVKAIWRHCATVYREIVGEGAYLRFPNKHPDYPDRWAELCAAVSSDIIVPAFQLWVAKEGKYIKTQWALSEFLKSDTAARYCEMVKPNNELKPKITENVIKASAEYAIKKDAALWDANTKSSEPGPEEF